MKSGHNNRKNQNLAAANSLMLNALSQASSEFDTANNMSEIEMDSTSGGVGGSAGSVGTAATNKEKAEKALAAGGGGGPGKSAIAKKEERTVNIVRLLVMCAIFFSAIAVSTAVYFFARDSDDNSFELEVSFSELELSSFSAFFVLCGLFVKRNVILKVWFSSRLGTKQNSPATIANML